MDEDKKKVDEIDPKSPAPIDDASDPNDLVVDGAPVDTKPLAPEATPSAPTPPPAAAPVDNPMGTPPDSGPIAGVVDVVGQAPQTPQRAPSPVQGMMLQGPTTPQQTAQYLKAQDQDTYDDLVSGHIHPKTMQDYFHDQNTVGKIGTLFGLLVSGMGSGLAHQPNAVLEMMNKTIQNDLEAQKASKSNAQNLIKINMDHQLQQTQQGLLGAQTANAQAEARLKADALTHMQMNRLGLYQMTKQVENLQNAANADPTNIAKQQQLQKAQQALAMIAQGVDAQNGNIADRAAAMGAILGAQTPAPANADTGVDLVRLNNAILAGKNGSPLGLNESEAAEAKKQADFVTGNRADMRMYADSFQNLNQLDAGHVEPGRRDAEINSIIGKIARSTTGMYNSAEAQSQVRAMFPEATDTPKLREEKFRKAMDHFKSMESGTTLLDTKGLKTPFPKYSSKKDPNEGKKAKDKKTGEEFVMKNGEWYSTKTGLKRPK